MIGDRRERGYRTGQIKGRDFLYITGVAGMGGSGTNVPLSSFRYLWWSIPTHRLSVLNTKLELYNENFEVYDRYLTPATPTQLPQPYRILLSTKPPVNDAVDYTAIKSATSVAPGMGVGREWVMREEMLPQPVDQGYTGNMYVIIDMLSVGRAPIADIVLNETPEYEAMRTKVYDYEARL